MIVVAHRAIDDQASDSDAAIVLAQGDASGAEHWANDLTGASRLLPTGIAPAQAAA